MSKGFKTMSEAEYLKVYEEHKANGTLPKGRNLQALQELAGIKPTGPVHCGKISSHAGWYRGKWVTDTCRCGHKFKVPQGSKGKYRCNCCANRDW